MTDIRIQQAREHYAAATAFDVQARRRRDMRDRLVRQLREEDPKKWTFGQLAREIGCSKELIAFICGPGS